MSMPRYTCMASTATISVPGTASAAAMATSDLPEAVGPSTTTGAAVMSQRGDRDAGAVRRLGQEVDEAPGEVVRRRTGDLDAGVRAGAQRPRRGEVDEAVVRRTGRQHRGILAARALDEHLLDAPDARLVGGQGAAFDDDPQ